MPVDHIMCETGMKRKNRGSSLYFKIGLEGDCMRQGRKEANGFLMYLFHCILCLLPYEFVVFSLSHASSILTTSSLKVAIVRSSPDISLFFSA